MPSIKVLEFRVQELWKGFNFVNMFDINLCVFIHQIVKMAELV